MKELDNLYKMIMNNAKDYDEDLSNQTYEEENQTYLDKIKDEFGYCIESIEGDASSRDCWVYLIDGYISDDMDCHTVHEKSFEECYKVLSNGITKVDKDDPRYAGYGNKPMNEAEDKFNPKNVKASVMLTYELEDDDTPTGGISFVGEQLQDFIGDTGIAKNTTISELNKALKDNGIKPITAEDIKRYMNEHGVKEAEDKDKPYILSEKEYDVVDKVMTNSGMIDAYFIGNYDADGWDQEKNGDAWWDFENDKRISMEDGLSYLAEGFTSAEDYNLTSSEYKTLQRLCAKFDVSI